MDEVYIDPAVKRCPVCHTDFTTNHFAASRQPAIACMVCEEKRAKSEEPVEPSIRLTLFEFADASSRTSWLASGLPLPRRHGLLTNAFKAIERITRGNHYFAYAVLMYDGDNETFLAPATAQMRGRFASIGVIGRIGARLVAVEAMPPVPIPSPKLNRAARRKKVAT